MKKLSYILCFLLLATRLSAEDLVYLEHSETLDFDEERIADAQILRGNVIFRHDNALMYCDSAYFYEKTNSLDAFGHVRFIQGDTLSGYGDKMYYDGNRKFARLRGHVKMIHRATVLTTDSLNYDRIRELAWYFHNGQIADTVSTLTSVWGQYNPPTKKAQFRDNVHLVNERFVLDADTLNYNTHTHIADLVSPTTIIYEQETTILSSSGWYNTETEQSMLLNRSQVLHSDGKQLTGDTIFYDKHWKYGKTIGHFQMRDTVNKSTLYGNFSEVFDDGDNGYATDSALLVDWSNDTAWTYTSADTIRTMMETYTLNDTLSDTIHTRDTACRAIRAYYNVRLFNKDYQMACDSMYYSNLDSIALLLGDPICWSDSQQVSADTIRVYMKNETVDYAHGIGHAIMIKHEAASFFDQMQGKEMKAYVRDGELRQVDVEGNAETVFYPREEDGTFMGLNRTVSSYVQIFIVDEKVDHVLFTTETNGTMYPLTNVDENLKWLTGYYWAEHARVLDEHDVFRRTPHTVRPDQGVHSASEQSGAEESQVSQPKQRNKKKKQ